MFAQERQRSSLKDVRRHRLAKEARGKRNPEATKEQMHD
jgi:hypothetical protein